MKLHSTPESFGPVFSVFLLSLLFVLGSALNGHAATPLATATITDTALGGGEFNYNIVLDNTGTGPIGTFWFGWVPGADFMSTRPSNIVTPTNWTANITGGGSGDGFAIQWLASTPLAAGSTKDFSFESTETPSELAGISTSSLSFPGFPTETAFVYGGIPFSDSGDQFVVQNVPEPSTVAELVVGVLGISYMGWRRRRLQSASALN